MDRDNVLDLIATEDTNALADLEDAGENVEHDDTTAPLREWGDGPV